MNDNVFVDTNIILYGYSNSDKLKQEIVFNLFNNKHCFISTQVLQECSNIFFKKFNIQEVTILSSIKKLAEDFNVVVNDENTIITAIQLKSKYNYSFYDSLIIAAALQSKCNILYTEDLHHNQTIEDTLTIINPFK